MVSAYIGLGANLGDPVQAIINARHRLKALEYCSDLISSSLYWSSPVGYREQPAFVNCVVKMHVSASAVELFTDMQNIEHSLGRQRDPSNRNAARLIDLDLLLFGDQEIKQKNLLVPHPRLLERRFVLEPLLEISPQITLRGEHLAKYYDARLDNEGYQGQELYRLGAGLDADMRRGNPHSSKCAESHRG